MKAALERQARAHGRSTEVQAREILQEVVRDLAVQPIQLGTTIATRFRQALRAISRSFGDILPGQPTATSVAVAAARSQLGVPYVWGAESPSVGFDCSGLSLWAYSRAGIGLPRTTWGQRDEGAVVSISQVQPGDLVFSSGLGHMSIAVGGGRIIHAPHTGAVVQYASLYLYGNAPMKVVRPTA